MPRAVKITLKLCLKLYKLNSETETELRKLILGLIRISRLHVIIEKSNKKILLAYSILATFYQLTLWIQEGHDMLPFFICIGSIFAK